MGDYSQKLARRRFLKLVGAGSAAGLLAACGTSTPGASSNTVSTAASGDAAPAAPAGAPAKDVTATLQIFNFGGDADKKIYADAEERFKKRYPNVTIQDNFTPADSWSAYSNKLTTQIAGGQSPDIINLAIEGARLVVSKGLMTPLDDYITRADSNELIGDVAPSLIDALKIDGKNYYIPNSWNNMVIYYNTKMFQAAGIEPPKPDWTWDDFLSIAKKLTTGSGADQVYGFAVPFFNFGLMPWFLTNGTSTLNADWSESNLNDPKVLESVQFVNDLVNVHKVAPAVEGTDAENLFTSGRIAMGGWGHWPIQGFLAKNFRDFDVQLWPRKTASTSVFGVGGWGIPQASKNKELAWELIKDLNSVDTFKATAQAGVAIPARRSVATSADFLKFPMNSKIYYDCLSDAKPVPSPANFSDVEGIIMRHMGEIMSAATTPADGLKAAHDELSAAMKKLKG